jgi:hypothetical protein
MPFNAKLLGISAGIGILFLAALSNAAPPKPAPPAKPPNQVKPAAEQRLSDSWYTVTVNKVLRYEYYNERIELRKGRLFFQSHVWKREEDFINEEQLGAYAETNADVSPLFYNFHSTYRSTETTIDGTVRDGKELSVRVRKGNSDLPLVKKNLPQKAFFSIFFPVWLSFRVSSLKPGATLSFYTVLEDNLETNFSVVTGNVRLEAPDEYAKRTQASKLLVDYRGLRSHWYVDGKGIPLRIDMPEQKTLVERVPRDAAEKFLDE